MKFSQYIFLAVLCVFAKQSQGNTLTSLSDSAKLEQFVVDDKFQNGEEAIIMGSTDKDSLITKAAIEDIRNEITKYPDYVASSPAAKTAVEGVLEAVRLIHTTERQANKALDTALDMVKAENIEGASEVVKKSFEFERELVFIAGVPIHDAQGAALTLVGGLAVPGLRNTIISIQKAGSAAFEMLEIALEIATAGIKEGGLAAEEAIRSARNIISTGLLAIYNHLRKANTHALEGIQSAVLNANNEADVVTGIIHGLKTQISTDNSAALDFIAKLSKSFRSVLTVLTKKPAIDAANVLYEGIRSTIVETANAISVAQEALEEASKLASQNPEAAIAMVRKGTKAAKNNILAASGPGYLGIGVAVELIGKAGQKLVPFVIEIEYGRVTAYEQLALMERTAIVAIEGGDLAASYGINSCIEMCRTAGIALYQDYNDAFENGIKVFQAI